jgi:solute carrier family 10 (sodium/bile acid cotransporter), member 7
VFAVVLYQLLQLLLLMVIAWYLLRFFWRDEPALRVMGLFGCTHKTIAMGVPLITAMYKDDPNLGQYILPILIWHPMQLIVGTLLTPRLSNFIIKEKERLGIVDDDDIGHDKSNDDDDGNDDEEAQEEAAGEFTPEKTSDDDSIKA